MEKFFEKENRLLCILQNFEQVAVLYNSVSNLISQIEKLRAQEI